MKTPPIYHVDALGGAVYAYKRQDEDWREWTLRQVGLPATEPRLSGHTGLHGLAPPPPFLPPHRVHGDRHVKDDEADGGGRADGRQDEVFERRTP